MRRVLIGLGAIVALFVVVVGGAFALINLGEVVDLRTTTKQGQIIGTRLWIVDDAGTMWLTPGRANRGWLRRLEADSQVELVRDGQARCYRAVAVDVPETRDRIRALMREKYRLQSIGAAILNALFFAKGAPSDVVVRLDPC